MKYVDIILKYLSGDLSGSESLSFEKDLERNPEMQSEFKQVKLIYDQLSEELKIKHPGSEKKENIIRDIIVDHDLEVYRGPVEESDEIEFISKLKAQSKNARAEPEKKRVSLYKSPLFYLALAASVSLLLILMQPAATSDQLFAKYYQPGSDKILVHLGESSRDETLSGISLYKRGLYKQALAYFEPYIQQDAPDPYIKLFYALSSIEENKSIEADIILNPESIALDDDINLAITWYYSLYLIHENKTTQAVKYLKILGEEKNPYFRDARSLLRKIN